MDINLLKDNTIIICNNDFKEDILLNISYAKKIMNLKFYTKKEFFDKYLFNVKEEALYYLVKKYNYKIDIASVYLKNLIFIDENTKYNNAKLDKLVNIKKELIDNDLISYDLSFKDYLKKFNVIVIGYQYLETFEESILNTVDAKIIKNKGSFKHDEVYEFNTAFEEITFVADQISKLLLSGININNIKITGINDEYYEQLERIFKFYNIPIKIPYKTSLYELNISKLFLDNLDKGLNEALDIIKDEDSKIVNKIVSICNKYPFIEDKNDLKDILEYEFKKTNVHEFLYQNYVEIKDINSSFSDKDYVFLMNFNKGEIPVVKKDEDYITDNLRKILNIKTIEDINKEIKEHTINCISCIKNIIITYKLKNNNNDYYPSLLVNDLNMQVLHSNNEEVHYSYLSDKLLYAKDLDEYYKYGVESENLPTYYNTFGDIKYHTYLNDFTGVNKDSLYQRLNNKLTLSYSSLDLYERCAFKFYLSRVLKLDIFEETFAIFIGSLFHEVLEKTLNNNTSVAAEINSFINKKKRVLTNKEKYYISKIEKDINFVIDTIKMQNKLTTFDKALYEQRFNISINKDIPVTFTGIIDKLLYKEKDNKQLVAIIDYKTGSVDIDLKNIYYGFSMQLPIYLYLVKNSKLFSNPKIVGFYLQHILNNEVLKDPKKSYQKQKEEILKLQGYSNDDISLLRWFDTTYEDSSLIKSMKVKKDGGFSAYAKVLNEKQIDSLYNLTEKHIDNAINNILDGNFKINPKKIGYDNNIGCKYCKFRDICFHKEEDYLLLEKIDDLSFLGGVEDA